jgi:DNA-directed RNA polymerase subunit RPC12/RpoP
METICEHCGAKLNIPDRKIPKNQTVKIACPKCKKKMTLKARKEHNETGSFHLQFLESSQGEGSEEAPYGYSDYTDDQALAFYEEGTKLALVMDNNSEHTDNIRMDVGQLGYKAISAPNIRDAIGRMRYHHFDLVILCDGFDGQSLERNPILSYLNNLSMSIRRRMFVVLMGEGFKTMDDMMAFALSVNLVVNTKELDKLSAILKRAISDYEKFYKVFMDTLVEAGKV